MVYRYVTAEVEVDLSEFDTDALLEELENRGETIGPDHSRESNELLTAIWERRRLGHDYQNELDALIYQVLGKVL